MSSNLSSNFLSCLKQNFRNLLSSSLLNEVNWNLASIKLWLSVNLATVLQTNLGQVLFSFIVLEEYVLPALCWLSYMLWDSLARLSYSSPLWWSTISFLIVVFFQLTDFRIKLFYRFLNVKKVISYPH